MCICVLLAKKNLPHSGAAGYFVQSLHLIEAEVLGTNLPSLT